MKRRLSARHAAVVKSDYAVVVTRISNRGGQERLAHQYFFPRRVKPGVETLGFLRLRDRGRSDKHDQ